MKSLVWYTDNLRVADHPLLTAACAQGNEVAAVYCYDPKHFEGNNSKGYVKIGAYRAKFIIESVLELQTNLKALNIPLYILVGSPELTIPALVKDKGITDIYTQEVWHSEELNRNNKVFKQLSDEVKIHKAYDQFLLDKEQWPFTLFRLPDVFSTFRNKVEKNLKIPLPLPVPAPMAKTNLQMTAKAKTDNPLEINKWDSIVSEAINIKTDYRSAFPFKGGEIQALLRLRSYLWETDHVATYKNTRNGLLGTEYSTKFSAWLANGSISARTIYVELKKYEASRTKNESTYWVFFELLWRDFFKCVGLKYGDRIFKSGGILNKEFADGKDYKKFESWKNGSTGDAFINANMKELAHTGWMSNRGRQNVASFWSKSWEQDWRVGAAYFESVLIDYDVDCNWGNWMYISGVGNDPRDRIFDSKRQAQMYDASGSFQKKWL